jgi:hypothetical protein
MSPSLSGQAQVIEGNKIGRSAGGKAGIRGGMVAVSEQRPFGLVSSAIITSGQGRTDAAMRRRICTRAARCMPTSRHVQYVSLSAKLLRALCESVYHS